MQKRIVTLEYEVRVAGKDGALLESSKERGPLRFVSGTGQLLPALEKRIDALAVGGEESGVIPAKEAFGDESVLPVKEIARKEFPAGEALEVGRIFEARAAGGESVRFKIVEAGKEVVKVRFLHALHDKDIAYRVKVLAVERADRPPSLPASVLELEEVND
jgi:FKBP-type peptidyl-prolyl cis-trans isomerase 2